MSLLLRVLKYITVARRPAAEPCTAEATLETIALR
jgi:hypothetical protein